jgi:cytochrome c553
MKRVFVSFIWVVFCSFSAFADSGASRGAALANACATCHGPDGRSQGAIPSINSLSKENFVAAMRAFQTGERQGTVMNRIAKGLDEADIEAVASSLVVEHPQ